jgi:hypothetical protein
MKEKKKIIQLRSKNRAIFNADVIDVLIAHDDCSDGALIECGYVELTIFIGKEKLVIFYEINSELDCKYYREDAERIRFALNKIGGNV